MWAQHRRRTTSADRRLEQKRHGRIERPIFRKTNRLESRIGMHYFDAGVKELLPVDNQFSGGTLTLVSILLPGLLVLSEPMASKTAANG